MNSVYHRIGDNTVSCLKLKKRKAKGQTMSVRMTINNLTCGKRYGYRVDVSL